jgi:predicted regulator of Ras-like GTPase activity (Roadblock/LC7/MglB family)
MMLLSAIIGLGAATLLLTAGYLFGVKQGRHAREKLHRQNLMQAAEMRQLPEQLPQQHNEQDDSLRATIQQVLTPLVQRERLSHELSHLETRLGHDSDLKALLDQLAEKGNFEAVLLGDEAGWPLAASSNTRDLEKLGAISSLLLLSADRMSRDGAPAPLALMIHDEANKVTLCRIFRVGGQRLSLIAASTGAQLTPTALDPALVKVDAVLLNRNYQKLDT